MNLDLPFAIDKANQDKPSVTLLFAYVSFTLSVGVDIALCFKDLTTGLLGAIVLFLISLVMYRMRQLDRFKLSKDSIEIDDDSSR
jgi:hypothetical protein